MNITLKQLKTFNACQHGIDWFKNQKDREVKKVLRKLLKQDHFDYARWYILKLFTQSQAVLFSIFCAERCIEIFEKKFPDDKRPRKALQAAYEWLKSPSAKTKNAAHAAYVAYAAAHADAAYVAYAAVADAAYVAAHDAYAAADAAYVAAHAAYAAAAYVAAHDAYAADAAYVAAHANTSTDVKNIIIEKAIEILGL